jgi:Asp-tRNA(Asn)/Glu-tRNA(Gln) amidotransferase C subunit
MGMFLSLTSVIGKTQNEVVHSLTNYAKSVGGGLEKESLSIDNENCCVIEDGNGNTTIFNPYAYLEWDKSSEFISKDLNAPVFSFHIHDGDLWMYVFFVNGVTVDQFNPIPDYWDENISEEEIESWKGNAAIIVKYLSNVNQVDIEKYLIRWDLDAEETEKTYPDDEFTNEDWQLLDFMKKLRLPYPLDDNGTPKGQVYKLWTNELRIKIQPSSANANKPTETADNAKKPWWKFW